MGWGMTRLPVGQKVVQEMRQCGRLGVQWEVEGVRARHWGLIKRTTRRERRLIEADWRQLRETWEFTSIPVDEEYFWNDMSRHFTAFQLPVEVCHLRSSLLS